MHLNTYYIYTHKNHGSNAPSRPLSLPFQHETPRSFPPDESRPYHLRWSLSGTPPGLVTAKKKGWNQGNPMQFQVELGGILWWFYYKTKGKWWFNHYKWWFYGDFRWNSSELCFFKIWLVVDLPLWKIWVRQLGWWNSQYMEKSKPWMIVDVSILFAGKLGNCWNHWLSL